MRSSPGVDHIIVLTVWHAGIMQHYTINPLSALLTYTHMSWCFHPLNFFVCLLFCRGIHWKVNRKCCNSISNKVWCPYQIKKKRCKTPEAQHRGFVCLYSNVSSQGVNAEIFDKQRHEIGRFQKGPARETDTT